MHVYMCVSFFYFIFLLFYFLFKETKYIDDGRSICMSVCMYVEFNWFPGQGKEKIKTKWIKMNYLINKMGAVMFVKKMMTRCGLYC